MYLTLHGEIDITKILENVIVTSNLHKNEEKLNYYIPKICKKKRSFDVKKIKKNWRQK